MADSTPPPQNLPWFVSTDEELWHDGGLTRDAAIATGRDDYDGEGFWIAQGESGRPWAHLFDTADDLAEFIDDHNEDNTYEDGFCEEAAIDASELQDMTAKINAVWSEFVSRTDPRSRSMKTYNVERIEPPSEPEA